MLKVQKNKFILCLILIMLTAGLFQPTLADTDIPPNSILSPVAPLPKPVVIYNKAFADRIGLDPTKAVNLDPGLYAVVLTFKKRYGLDITPDDPFIKRHHLNDLTPTEMQLVGRHLEVFPILFRHEAMPLYVHYDCYLNLYIKSNDKRLRDARLPNQRLWDKASEQDIESLMITPIDEQQIAPVQSDGLMLTTAQGKVKPYTLSQYFKAYQNTPFPLTLFVQTPKSFTDPAYLKHHALGVESYLHDFIPGITFISFKEPICANISHESNAKGAVLWLEKKSGPDFNTPEGLKKMTIADFYRFQIPAQITRSLELKAVMPYSKEPLGDPVKVIK